MANTTLNKKEIEKLIDQKVNVAMRRALGDPDFGLELRPVFIKEMKWRLQHRPKNLIPFEEIKKKYL
ncbi:MAG TPA: hypothetical protein VJK09_00815 [Candidatus Paceibacterota bacterium]